MSVGDAETDSDVDTVGDAVKQLVADVDTESEIVADVVSVSVSDEHAVDVTDGEGDSVAETDTGTDREIIPENTVGVTVVDDIAVCVRV